MIIYVFTLIISTKKIFNCTRKGKFFPNSNLLFIIQSGANNGA